MTVNDDQSRIETMGIRLGYLGLLPFVAGAVAHYYPMSSRLSHRKRLFCIHLRSCHSWAVFIGVGAYLRYASGARLVISVIPVVVAWICLMTLPEHFTLAVLGGGFIAQWIVDRPIFEELPVRLDALRCVRVWRTWWRAVTSSCCSD